MGISIETLVAAKKFTSETALGGGAVVGKNVTISSITPIEGGNKVTFSYTLDNGTVKTSTMDVMDGKDGVSVSNIDVNANNQIVFTMSDGTEYISGIIPTVKGDKGDKGNPGEKGNPGYTPVKGTDYWTSEDISEIQSYIDTQIGGALNGTY